MLLISQTLDNRAREKEIICYTSQYNKSYLTPFKKLKKMIVFISQRLVEWRGLKLSTFFAF